MRFLDLGRALGFVSGSEGAPGLRSGWTTWCSFTTRRVHCERSYNLGWLCAQETG